MEQFSFSAALNTWKRLMQRANCFFIKQLSNDSVFKEFSVLLLTQCEYVPCSILHVDI